MKKIILILICVSAISLCGCASGQDQNEDKVTFDEVLKDFKGEPVIPREANRIYLTPFNNRSVKRDIDEILMIKIRDAIIRDMRLAVTSDANNTDLVLTGTIQSYTIQMIKFNPIGEPEKKRMRITAVVTLMNSRDGAIIFERTGVQAFKEYSDTVPPILTENQVLLDVINELADRITLQTITGAYTGKMTNVEKGGKK